MIAKQKYKVFEKTTNNRHIAYKRTKGVFFLITRLEPKIECVDEANTYLYNKMLGLNNGRCLSNKTTKNLAHLICALYNFSILCSKCHKLKNSKILASFI